MNPVDRLAYDVRIWVIVLGLLLVMAVAWELGSRLHARVAATRGEGEEVAEAGQVLGAVLGLLALLVAFTFSLALNRYEARRALVVEEANALGTAYLRTSLLDQPEHLRGLLRAYASERLAYGLAEGPPQAQAAARAEVLQRTVWAEANLQVRPQRNTVIASLVLSPLNESFDLASSRAALLAARIPLTVLIVLWLYAIVAAGVLGYAIGGGPRPHRGASMVMFVLLSLALGLILDLDRPRGGSIRVPQTPMSAAIAAMR
jgi:hypothetical protein